MKLKAVTVYMLIGLPGSGKSTWARTRAARSKSLVIVARDELRRMLLGRYGVDPRTEPLVTALTGAAVRFSVNRGLGAIVDETNLTIRHRNRWIRNLKRIDRRSGRAIRIVFVLFTESRRNLEYRMKDPRGMSRPEWAFVIDGMRKRIEEPRLSEGCDKIMKITVLPGSKT